MGAHHADSAISTAATVLGYTQAWIHPRLRKDLEKIAADEPCPHSCCGGDDEQGHLECAACGAVLGNFDPSIDRTGMAVSVLNQVDRNYVGKLISSCEDTYEELPAEVQRAMGRIRVSGFKDRLHKMVTHHDRKDS
jgi:hypothetical protein